MKHKPGMGFNPDTFRFPRVIKRGLIEAGGFWFRPPFVCVFPRLIKRGLIEAGPHPRCAPVPHPFPRLIKWGLIEAARNL